MHTRSDVDQGRTVGIYVIGDDQAWLTVGEDFAQCNSEIVVKYSSAVSREECASSLRRLAAVIEEDEFHVDIKSSTDYGPRGGLRLRSS
jgi:hypothetical protein